MTGYANYARTNIQTSDPRAVIVLLYEGAIRFLNQAADALRRENRPEMSEHITKTLRIIQFLASAIDFDEGGEIAENLEKLYNYMRDTLSEANVKADAKKIQEVIGLFRPLLEAWREIAKDPAAATALEKRAAELAAVPATMADPTPASVAQSSHAPEGREGETGTPGAPPKSALEPAAAGPNPARAPAPTGLAVEASRPTSSGPSTKPVSDTAIAGRAAYGLRTTG